MVVVAVAATNTSVQLVSRYDERTLTKKVGRQGGPDSQQSITTAGTTGSLMSFMDSRISKRA